MDIGTQTHLHALRDLLTYREHELTALLHAADLARAGGSAPEDAHGEACDRAQMADVRAALHRLECGVYGDCVSCGQPIPLQRLLVQPAAARCAACEAAVEGGEPGRPLRSS